MDSKALIRKTVFNLALYGLYYTGTYYIIRPEIFENFYYVLYLGMHYFTGIADTYLRPLETEEKEKGSYVKYILMLMLLNPFLFILALLEHDLLFNDLDHRISIIGLIIYGISSIIFLFSRIQLGRQATGTLVIVDDHKLITTGLYRFVRHPIYASSILAVLGFALVVQSIIIGGISMALYLWIFNNRMRYEETILIEQFGKEYEDYMVNSYRLIPFVW